ncbi:MAG: four helix bundle protein [Acidobacteria bacterium]|nr:four helix bundle protein [Acidobacteriota bacterium]
MRDLAYIVLLSSGMSEQADELKKRTYQFTLDVIELAKTFSAVEPGPTIKRQLLKAATSVGANYRAACRARSHADFTSKIGVVAEEADECQYWLNVIADAKLTESPDLQRLQRESTELVAIFSSQVGTARLNEQRRRSKA